MPHISILSSSIRVERKSHRVARYFKNYLEENAIATVEILDLNQYNFPLFNERLRLQQSPTKDTLSFTEKIKQSEGVLIVTPEYNGGYPASLKNVIDLLYDEWYHKPVAIATVSEGPFGGSQVITQLQFMLWKMRAWVASSLFPVPKIREAFDEAGIPTDKLATDKRAEKFIHEFLWLMEAKSRMTDSEL
ncbi:MAG: NAD(P)H-dependent oxidoreductase [Bacteroidota bacterium]